MRALTQRPDRVVEQHVVVVVRRPRAPAGWCRCGCRRPRGRGGPWCSRRRGRSRARRRGGPAPSSRRSRRRPGARRASARVCSRIVCPAILISCLGMSRPTRVPTPPARMTATLRLMVIVLFLVIAAGAQALPDGELDRSADAERLELPIRSRCSGDRLAAARGQRLRRAAARRSPARGRRPRSPRSGPAPRCRGRVAQVELQQLGQEPVVVVRRVVHPERAPRVLGVGGERLVAQVDRVPAVRVDA